MTQLPYPTLYNDIIKCQIMESKSNYYHVKNDENNWNLIKQIINKYSVSHLQPGCFLSDCIGSTYDIEDIYNNMKSVMLVFNSNYNIQNQSNKKRKVSPSSKNNNTNNTKESNIKESNIDESNTEESNIDESNTEESNIEESNIDESNNMFNAYHELPDFMFRKKHAQHFLQTFKLPIDTKDSIWPFTIYFFSGNNVYYSDGYNGSKCGEFIFHKSINKQPIVFTNFINQLC